MIILQVIQHIELASTASGITFSNIPQTFTDLYLLTSTRHEGNDYGLSIQFNGSTANVVYRNLSGNGTSIGSGTGYFNQFGGSVRTAMSANTFSNNSLYLPNYTETTPRAYSADGATENNASASLTSIAAGIFNSTAPITSITVYGQTTTGSNAMVQYSSATLYGITAGSDGVTTVS